jgi:parallel beta-helix repeat protein
LTPGDEDRTRRPTVWPVLLLTSGLSILVVLAGWWLPGAAAHTGVGELKDRGAPTCSRVASPVGSDRSSGRARSPYRTVRRLVESLRPGMVGCLRAGKYGGVSYSSDMNRSGTSNARITLRSYPGERATLQGAINVDGNWITLTKLKIDVTTTPQGGTNDCGGPNYGNLILAGSNIVLDHNEISASNQRQSGNGVYVTGSNEVIRFNRIHNVGACNGYDHGIYVASSHHFRIEYNWIYDCRAGWGIQLFPNATDGRIRHNIIDGCGSGITISGSGDNTSRNNLIDHNLITNSVGFGRDNTGTAVAGCCNDTPDGNLVTRNMFWGNADGAFDSYVGRSYIARHNISVNPRYVNRAAKDFRVRSSRAKKLGLWNGGAQPRR